MKFALAKLAFGFDEDEMLLVRNQLVGGHAAMGPVVVPQDGYKAFVTGNQFQFSDGRFDYFVCETHRLSFLVCDALVCVSVEGSATLT